MPSARTPSKRLRPSQPSLSPPWAKQQRSHYRRPAETSRSHCSRTLGAMRSFVVRVWLPDRPGALGAVASRIGSVRGDLTGIEILERGGGRAIDELIVELPSEDLVP